MHLFPFQRRNAQGTLEGHAEGMGKRIAGGHAYLADRQRGASQQAAGQVNALLLNERADLAPRLFLKKLGEVLAAQMECGRNAANAQGRVRIVFLDILDATVQ